MKDIEKVMNYAYISNCVYCNGKDMFEKEKELQSETTQESDDVVSSSEDKVVAENKVQEELDALKTQLDVLVEKNNVLEEQVNSLKEGLASALTETENLRKRHKIELEKAGNDFMSKFIGDMTEVFENFYRAREHADGGEDTIRLVADGIKMNIKIFEDVLKKYNIERIFPQKGEMYDYHKHQAISTLGDDAYPANSILEVMRAGYICKDLLIKPALVSVSKKEVDV
ncbi:nucleotide exchange factor GrpE [Candidatus Fokinia crypta]|uniref:nucleotide exchange factor GrpE n=1 Tax=Candidatus Fokinia crypta TaxID=1920990 RepID=UPI002B258BAE|nr:nucleotide exchange factor GrpE [Candidatus Fokinia cryptica]